MRRAYSDEMKQFISENAIGRMDYELTDLFNKKFNTSFTESQIRAYRHNHHLYSGLPSTCRRPETKYKIFPKEIQQFVIDNVIGRYNLELTNMVNDKFGTNYTEGQIDNLKHRLQLNSGLTGRFEAGHVPANKGIKGVCASGCEKTWFQKGHIPSDHRPVGSERIDSKDGYTLVKVEEPSVWKLKQHVVWEQHHGPIPDGYKIIFLDQDKSNFDINNLALVSSSELLTMNRHKLISNDSDITQCGITVAKLIGATSSKKKAVENR